MKSDDGKSPQGTTRTSRTGSYWEHPHHLHLRAPVVLRRDRRARRERVRPRGRGALLRGPAEVILALPAVGTPRRDLVVGPSRWVDRPAVVGDAVVVERDDGLVVVGASSDRAIATRDAVFETTTTKEGDDDDDGDDAASGGVRRASAARRSRPAAASRRGASTN